MTTAVLIANIEGSPRRIRVRHKHIANGALIGNIVLAPGDTHTLHVWQGTAFEVTEVDPEEPGEAGLDTAELKRIFGEDVELPPYARSQPEAQA